MCNTLLLKSYVEIFHPVEYLIYYFPSEDADVHQDVSNVVAPHNKVGALSVQWSPLMPGDEDAETEEPDPEQLPEIEDPSQLLGQPWTYRIHISGATDLVEPANLAYCQYKFFNETHTTDTYEAQGSHDSSSSPTFDYTAIHHIDCVTQEFIDFLQEPFHINLFVKPHISRPPAGRSQHRQPGHHWIAIRWRSLFERRPSD